jgi:RimJ/RimL family protein N-acetyltransferase
MSRFSDYNNRVIELAPSSIQVVNPLFQSIDHSQAIVFSVLEGNSPGRVFVDGEKNPTVALLYPVGAFLYIAGDENHPSLTHELVPLIFDEILPGAGEQEMVLFAFSDSWRMKLDHLLQEKGAIRIARKTFRFNPDKFHALPDWRKRLPSGSTMVDISTTMAKAFPAYQPLVDPRTKRFGVCLLHNGEIASECSAVFVGRGEAEIDIHTEERFCGLGLATLTGSAFIEACLERGLTPDWACWPERLASWSLARKLGFEDLPDIPCHLWAPDL